MEICNVCNKTSSQSKLIMCNGTCNQRYHANCLGMNRNHLAALSAKVGFLWFCPACRLNFEPAVYDRDKIIMRALRELLTRMDSMDTRLGNYGENLRHINGVVFDQKKKLTNQSLNQTVFHKTIDQFTLDDSVDPLDRSRSCDETSFFEVLDDINCTLNQQPDKFIVGNKRVQIISGPSDGMSTQASTTSNASTSSTAGPSSVPPVDHSSRNLMNSTTVAPLLQQTDQRQPGFDSLKVARKGPQSESDENESSFYVTPFAPDQSEAAIQAHICEITHVDRSKVKVVKLIPRGKDHRDLTFVSFKATVPTNVQKTVGDKWYWPEGIEVRLFESRGKNYSSLRISGDT